MELETRFAIALFPIATPDRLLRWRHLAAEFIWTYAFLSRARERRRSLIFHARQNRLSLLERYTCRPLRDGAACRTFLSPEAARTRGKSVGFRSKRRSRRWTSRELRLILCSQSSRYKRFRLAVFASQFKRVSFGQLRVSSYDLFKKRALNRDNHCSCVFAAIRAARNSRGIMRSFEPRCYEQSMKSMKPIQKCICSTLDRSRSIF